MVVSAKCCALQEATENEYNVLPIVLCFSFYFYNVISELNIR
jgi:hypothetical protein